MGVCLCTRTGRGTLSNYHSEITQGHTALLESVNHTFRRASSLADFDTALTQCIQLTHFNDHVAN